MNISLKSFAVGVVSSVAWYALLFTPLVRTDPFGQALAPIAIAGGLGVLGIVLWVSYACNRWLLKTQRALSAALVCFVSLCLFVLLTRFVDSEWFGEAFHYFGLHTLVVCLPAVLFMFASMAKAVPNHPVEPASPGRAGSP